MHFPQNHLKPKNTNFEVAKAAGPDNLAQGSSLHSSLPNLTSPNAPLGVNQNQTPPIKKTRGKQKIKIEYIDAKPKRQITFYKRKAGLIKKAHELTTLTGTQILLLMASETGHIYTYATPDLQPLITLPENKAVIQSCLGQKPESNSVYDADVIGERSSAHPRITNQHPGESSSFSDYRRPQPTYPEFKATFATQDRHVDEESCKRLKLLSLPPLPTTFPMAQRSFHEPVTLQPIHYENLSVDDEEDSEVAS